MATKPVVVAILDGWGIGPRTEVNPIYISHPPFLESLEQEYPYASLEASGINVGLPWGEVGNSEVGHLTLGSGMIIFQHYPRISLSIRDGSFFKNEEIRNCFAQARANNGHVHMLGLLSQQNTFSALEHLKALIDFAKNERSYDSLFLHLIADGKDSRPKSLAELLKEVPMDKVATIFGRAFAIDRETNSQRTSQAYEALVTDGPIEPDFTAKLERFFKFAPSEEALPPLRLLPNSRLKDGDSLIVFNFREDSLRQITESLALPEFTGFPRSVFPKLHVMTLTRYSETYPFPAAFLPQIATVTLGSALSAAGKTQLRLAESEKYAHVTYFFNGYREEPYEGEFRVVVPRAENIRLDEHPELMSPAITDRLVAAISERSFDFILVNYAAPDIVAHTGNFDAGVKVVQSIDSELKRVWDAVEAVGGVLLITADHGNLEQMFDPVTWRPETTHNSSPVPLYLTSPQFKGRKFESYGASWRDSTLGSLADVAPTVLELLGVPVPSEMSGHSFLRNIR
jgi:2,3-bisphosphoglycerate-independent phosphoglycerate mutase